MKNRIFRAIGIDPEMNRNAKISWNHFLYLSWVLRLDCPRKRSQREFVCKLFKPISTVDCSDIEFQQVMTEIFASESEKINNPNKRYRERDFVEGEIDETSIPET